ncbi:MAG: hypothetical protein ABI867_02220 [Kofleriaceae bacterium]
MADKTLSSEITPPEMYFNQRTFLRGGVIAADVVGTGLTYRKVNGVDIVESKTKPLEGFVKDQNTRRRIHGHLQALLQAGPARRADGSLGGRGERGRDPVRMSLGHLWAVQECKLILGRVMMEAQDALTSADKAKGLIVACQARPVQNCEVEA